VAVISRNQQRAEDAVSFIGCDPATASTDLGQAKEGDILLLALPDDKLAPMAEQLQNDIELAAGTTLVHFSGLQPASVMSVEGSGCRVVSIHPLLSFADREMATKRLTDCPCALEGEQAVIPQAQELTAAIGGKAFQLPAEAKALYHSAACIASNYLVTITASARDLLVKCGIDKQQARELLIPIQQATCENLTHHNPEDALTGPIVRGDIGTVGCHISTIKEKHPELLDMYLCLGKQTIELATSSGRLQKEQAKRLRQLLENTKDDG